MSWISELKELSTHVPDKHQQLTTFLYTSKSFFQKFFKRRTSSYHEREIFEFNQ